MKIIHAFIEQKYLENIKDTLLMIYERVSECVCGSMFRYISECTYYRPGMVSAR